MLFAPKKPVVGIDIGTYAVKAVQLKQVGKSYHLLHFGTIPLTPEAIVDGTIMDRGVVVEAIRNLVQMERIKTKDVVTSISGQAVIFKKIRLPQMTEKELAETIPWEAEQHIPFALSEVNLDFHILPAAGGQEERLDNQMDVLLVAAKKARVDEVAGVLTEAGLHPVVIDVDVFALENGFEMSHGSNPGIVALVDIGATTMNINILRHGVTMFQRDIAIGGRQYTAALQKEFNVNYDQAEALKRGVGFTPTCGPEQVLPVMVAVSEDLSEELQRSFEFFRTTVAEEAIDRVVLSGGCAKIVGLDRFLNNRLGVSVEVANPFRNLQYNEKVFDPDYLQDMAPLAAVSVGLALRRMHDR